MRGKLMPSPRAPFNACADTLGLARGKGSSDLRSGVDRTCLEAYDDDCHFGLGTTLTHRQVRMGPGVDHGSRCIVGLVDVGKHVTIGGNVDLLSGRYQHNFDSLDRPIQRQGGSCQRIRTGRNSGMGNRSIVMADIGDDGIIGAGSVVGKPISERTVAAGNPGVIKKHRSPPPSKAPDLCRELAPERQK